MGIICNGKKSVAERLMHIVRKDKEAIMGKCIYIVAFIYFNVFTAVYSLF